MWFSNRLNICLKNFSNLGWFWRVICFQRILKSFHHLMNRLGMLLSTFNQRMFHQIKYSAMMIWQKAKVLLYQGSFPHAVEPRYKTRPRDWQNMFTIVKFRCIKVLFHLFYHWPQGYCSLHRGLRYVEVPLYFTFTYFTFRDTVTLHGPIGQFIAVQFIFIPVLTNGS